MLRVKTNSTTFLNHRNASNTTLICVPHGLPIPNLKCQTTSGAKLNASSTTHSDGVISAVLTMNELLSVTAVQCVTLSSETQEWTTRLCGLRRLLQFLLREVI